MLIKKARQGWANPAIKRAYGGLFIDFLNDVKTTTLQNLDYFNPKHGGHEGRPTPKPTTWMAKGVEEFCKAVSVKQIRIEEVEKKDRELALSPKIILPRQLKFLIAKIPVPARLIVRKLGLKIEDVAIAGFLSVRRKLLGMWRRAGLNKRELFMVSQGLKGRQMKEIRDSMKHKITRERIRQITNKALDKIKKQIEREQPF